MLILAYSAWSITTVLPANPWSDDNQLRIIIISVYSQFYCNIWAIKGTYGFISNGNELKHQSRADVLHRLVVWHWEDISPPPPRFVILTVFQSIYFQLGSRGFHTSFLPSLFSRNFCLMHKGNSNQQQPCLPCLFHISSFALPSTGASKDKRVQVGNETPDNGWKLCIKATHLLSLFLFFLHLLQPLLPAAFLQAEEKASRSKWEPSERRLLRGSRLPLDRWGGE